MNKEYVAKKSFSFFTRNAEGKAEQRVFSENYPVVFSNDVPEELIKMMLEREFIEEKPQQSDRAKLLIERIKKYNPENITTYVCLKEFPVLKRNIVFEVGDKIKNSHLIFSDVEIKGLIRHGFIKEEIEKNLAERIFDIRRSLKKRKFDTTENFERVAIEDTQEFQDLLAIANQIKHLNSVINGKLYGLNRPLTYLDGQTVRKPILEIEISEEDYEHLLWKKQGTEIDVYVKQ